MTDRTVPLLFPSADPDAFEQTARRALASEAPPPREVNTVVDDARRDRRAAGANLFLPADRRRVLVVLTDGESRPFAEGEVARALRAANIDLVTGPRGRRRRARLPPRRDRRAAVPPRPARGADARGARGRRGGAAVERGRPRRRRPRRGRTGARRRASTRASEASAGSSRSPPGSLCSRSSRSPSRSSRGSRAQRACDRFARRLRSALDEAADGLLLLGVAARSPASRAPRATATGGRLRQRRLARVRSDGRPEPVLAAEPDHAGERRQPRPRVQGRLPPDRRDREPRRAELPARDQRRPLHDHERQQRLGGRTATTGRVLWRHDPNKLALYSNFGIVANRGLAYCAGRLFLLTLDMHIVALNPRNGNVIREVPIAAAVPGASINFGYSETSAPMCANNRVVIGAAGLRVRRARLRDGVQARPLAGLGEPVLDDPARRPELAAAEPRRRRRRRLDADDDRRADEHALLRNRLGDAALLAAAAPRPQPADELARRRRPPHRPAQVVAAADDPEPVELRHGAAAARLQRPRRRQAAARRLGRRRWRASGSPTTRGPVARSTRACG